MMPSIPQSDAEWAALISNVESSVEVSEDQCALPSLDQQLAQYFDHTLLKLDATEEGIEKLCTEAKEHGFKTVCVRVNWVPKCKELLTGTDIGVACVIDFHEGTSTLQEKSEETKLAVAHGASELDLVLPRQFLTGDAEQYVTLYDHLNTIRTLAPSPTVLKIILETSQLSRSQIIAACTIAGFASFDFVKTSTGFCGRGASVDDVRLMRACSATLESQGFGCKKMAVKASGGIRTLKDTIEMIAAGATRLGASAGVGVMEEVNGRESKGGNAVAGGY
ncbi:deoxyribose-phosphate aldolase [Eremomyces bilateralis CBS 781.70]|uniref:deoxyribose-phosphate aldolase n=1 Tax=Eremomyces bilateralis CBS 781.70 TaxID=1392243 RepID=A0A6G1FW89_9PEZI|nr:deoxyribose-phosphate aldolase [Eremomyces bilateralis CBS 781.70]KAF1809889.1 deoxyribose-phosphate aldolase [Eremomyces bilateralis CBS 781.70]